MLANIGGASSTAGGNQVPGVQSGAVIASPSTAGPNYFYSWVRDAALTMKVVISQSTLDRTLVQNYANAEKVHQQNAASSSSGQGEPKFNTDGSLFTGPWGRPQNDSPALRASALIAFAKRIGLTDPFVTGTLYKSDLSAAASSRPTSSGCRTTGKTAASTCGRRCRVRTSSRSPCSAVRSSTVPSSPPR